VLKPNRGLSETPQASNKQALMSGLWTALQHQHKQALTTVKN
jgi:hypothetical protein